jgi:NAD(P)-dependent dehydrogenase (short-subunit alcohol dehydrogenase family)
MAHLLDNKVCLVTGAGGGLGRAYAKLFAAEGAAVVVNDLGGARDGSGTSSSAAQAVVDEIVAAGGRAIADASDVSTEAGAAQAIDTAVTTFGDLDVLVNNAGILRDKTLLKLDEEAFDAVVRVHLKSTFLCTQRFAKHRVAKGGGGRVVNTTSVSGMLGNFGQANYAAAKAGIYGFTRTASIEFQKHRITVNCVAPIAKTRMTEDLPMFTNVETLTPDHVAPAVLFLASDACGEKTGWVLAAAGARMYAFRVVETAGRFKEETGGVWTAEEIAENWDSIVKL